MPRIAVEEYWLFCYEWRHPEESEANAQELELLSGLQVTDYIGKIMKEAGARGR